MPMIIYQPIQATQEQFIEFWSSRYPNAQEDLYNDNIGQILTKKRVLQLFLWKNGIPLSGRKLESVQSNFIQRIEDLDRLQANVSANDFLAFFNKGGAIWRIFWLHCWQPKRFPIYDQHVHRAMAFICNGVSEEIPQNDPQKIESYINRYLPFHSNFTNSGRREVDMALWAFGKFIKEVKPPMV